MGLKKFNLVWVFQTLGALNRFIDSGFEVGAQTSAAAKTGDTGGSLAGTVAIAPDVWLYQLVEKGLALELTAKGAKYYKEGDLN